MGLVNYGKGKECIGRCLCNTNLFYMIAAAAANTAASHVDVIRKTYEFGKEL